MRQALPLAAFVLTAFAACARVQHTVRSCADFLPLAAEHPSTGSSLDDRTLGALGADCVALSWIGEAGLANAPVPPIARRAGLARCSYDSCRRSWR